MVLCHRTHVSDYQMLNLGVLGQILRWKLCFELEWNNGLGCLVLFCNYDHQDLGFGKLLEHLGLVVVSRLLCTL